MDDLERKAREFGADPARVEKYLRSMVQRLNQPYRGMFGGAEFDREGLYLSSPFDRYRLQWRVRIKPDEPVSYTNQQTSQGTAVLVNNPPTEPREFTT